MKVREVGTKLIVEDRPFVVPAVFALSAIVLAGIGIGIQFGYIEHEQPAWQAFASSALSAAVAMVFFSRERNIFDPEAGQFRWSKWNLLRETRGAIPFADITSVTLETSSSSETVPSCRITVHTTTDAVPLSRFYSSSAAIQEPTAELIRSVIGLETKDLTEDSVRAMVAAGRKIDAIRLLRIRNRLGLKEAKVEVERLSRS